VSVCGSNISILFCEHGKQDSAFQDLCGALEDETAADRELLPTLGKPKGTHSYTSIPDEREVGTSDPTVAEQVSVAIMFSCCAREVLQ
jgi:hypothetical protein